MARMFRDRMSEEEYQKRLFRAKIKLNYENAIRNSYVKALGESVYGGYLRKFCEESQETIDKERQSGISFYRIKESDMNGKD